jgi:hypothetical protein
MNHSILILLLLSQFSKDLNSCKAMFASELRAVEVSHSFPMSNWTTSIPDTTMMYRVYYYNDLVLHKFPFSFSLFQKNELIKEETRYEHFVIHADSLFGFMYSQGPYEKTLPGKRMHIDSACGNKLAKIIHGDMLASLKPDSSYSSPEGLLVKTYSPPPVDETDTIPYTVSFHYSKKLYGITETFSEQMDNIPGMKLFKIVITPKRPMMPGFPMKPMIYEMKDIIVNDQEKILSFFTKYQAEYRMK